MRVSRMLWAAAFTAVIAVVAWFAPGSLGGGAALASLLLLVASAGTVVAVVLHHHPLPRVAAALGAGLAVAVVGLAATVFAPHPLAF